MGKVTIADVARTAGVSPTTVSHVLTARRPVKPETALRVSETMRTLGYVPHFGARSMRSGTSRMIGILVPDISNPYFAMLARGAADAAEDSGYGLSLFHTDWRGDREVRYLDALRGGGIDGLVYAAGMPPSPTRLRNLLGALPVAVVDEELPGFGSVTVVSDNFHGGEEAGRHLAEFGHRQILYISGPPRLETSQLREAGLRQSFKNVPTARIEVRSGDYRFDGGYSATAAELESTGQWFTAIFAANDLMALGAMRALAERGLSVPTDISVIGFDDIEVAVILPGGLSTIRQPRYEIGRSAVDWLVSILRRPAPPPSAHLVLDIALIIRSTTGPAGLHDAAQAEALTRTEARSGSVVGREPRY